MTRPKLIKVSSCETGYHDYTPPIPNALCSLPNLIRCPPPVHRECHCVGVQQQAPQRWTRRLCAHVGPVGSLVCHRIARLNRQCDCTVLYLAIGFVLKFSEFLEHARHVIFPTNQSQCGLRPGLYSLHCHGNENCRTVKMSSIDDFVVACEVGDLAWMRRCLRSGIDPAGRDRQVRGCACGSVADCVAGRTIVKVSAVCASTPGIPPGRSVASLHQ